MKLWHSDEVVIWDGVTSYWGGKYDFVDYCDYDKMSIVELNDIVRSKLNYAVGAVYYLKVPGVEELQRVESDAQLLRCLDRILLFTRVVEVYCSHPVNAPEVARESIGAGGSNVPPENVVNQSDHEHLDPEFRDSDYEQSAEEDIVDDSVEKNLEGLQRRKKGKAIDIDVDDGFIVTNSKSDDEHEFVGKPGRQSSDSEDDNEQQPCADKVVTSKRRRKKTILPRLPEFNPSSDLKNPYFQLGLVFPNGERFKAAIREYAVKAGKAIYFKVNEGGRVRAACSRKTGGCPWVCFASKVSGK